MAPFGIGFLSSSYITVSGWEADFWVNPKRRAYTSTPSPGKLQRTSPGEGEGEMVERDFFIEEVETRRGERLKITTLAVEPVADIAALGCLDAQSFCKEVETFESF